MRLNRERIVAGLSLLVLVFGVYRMLGSKLLGPPPQPISTDIPTSAQDLARVEPRLYIEDSSGDRNPYQLASDWAPLSPQDLRAPPVEPTRWLALPLGRGEDPELAGFIYLEAPPEEQKAADEEKAVPEPAAAPAPAPEPAPAGDGKAGAAPGTGTEKKAGPPAIKRTKDSRPGGRR